MVTNNGKTSIELSDKKIKWSNLNLLEIVLSKNRRTIINECSKKQIDLSNYSDVAKYILDSKK